MTSTGDSAALSGTDRADLTVAEMRTWLRNWVAKATGQAPEAINETAPMIELGLSSRDAVAMASDIEDFAGVTLSATVAFRHPTIEALATVIVEGEPVLDDAGDDEDWSRAEDVADIAVVGLATRFSLQGLGEEERFPPDVELALFRVTQESVNNAVKHARASTVDVELSRDPSSLVLEVTDDGVGFAADNGGGSGLGLSQMRERMAQLRGSLDIHSSPGHGTRVVARIPLAQLS